MFLAFINQSLQHFTLGAVPKPIINQLSIFGHQLIFQMRRAAIQGDLLDTAMRFQQNCTARGFVNAARFHANKAPLDQIQPTNAMRAAQRIQPREQLRWRQRFAIYRNRISPRKTNFNKFGFIGCIFRIDRPLIDVIRRIQGGIFQNLALR